MLTVYRGIKMQNRKSFEEYYSDAVTSIPLYTDEWTDYGPSDPGITMIENLTAFNVLQQNFIERAAQECKLSMLEFAGFKRGGQHTAKMYVKAQNVTEPFLLPSNQKFTVGNLTFENNRAVEISGDRIEHIFHLEDGRAVSHDKLLDREFPSSEYVFGGRPEKGAELYFITSALPEPGKELLMYVTIDDIHKRNKLDLMAKNPFASIKWQVYANGRFVDLKANDYTGCFLQDGVIKLTMSRQPPQKYTHYGYDGYAVRAVLENAGYDIAPRIKHVDGYVFEVWQKSSEAFCYTFRNNEKIIVYNELLELGYISVFVREDNEDSYRKYELIADDGHAWSDADDDRHCFIRRLADGMYKISFDERSGYRPGAYSNAVKLVVYGDTAMRGYNLGTVYGYDNQTIELPCDGVIDGHLSIIAQRSGVAGTVYDFVKPGCGGDGDLSYHLNDAGNAIIIDDAGKYINSTIYIGTLACTLGAQGNIDAGKRLTASGYTSQAEFMNVSSGTGGRSEASSGELEERFERLSRSSCTAVTAEDYSRILKGIPGLCIKKINTFCGDRDNEVIVAVLPESEKQFPRLSAEYMKLLSEYADRHRMLCTRVHIVSPEYAYVDAFVKLKVARTSRVRAAAEQLLKNMLDYINTDKNFGQKLEFEKVYRQISMLEDVLGVGELRLSCNSAHVAYSGLDIVPDNNCLLYPGAIIIKLEE